MTVLICYSRCWSCQFGQHEGGPHTWMDEEDAECSKTVTVPRNAHEWKVLAETHPCACWCLTTAPCRACQGSGSHPDDELTACDRCDGRGHPADVVVSMRPPENVQVEHGPAAVRRDLGSRWPYRVAAYRRVMADCSGCRSWSARRARLATLHRAYRHRRRGQ